MDRIPQGRDEDAWAIVDFFKWFRGSIRSKVPVLSPGYAFLATSDSGGTVAGGNVTTRTWPNEVFDVGDCFDSNLFTAPVDGVYHFDTLSTFVANPERVKGAFFVNGSVAYVGQYWDVNGIATGQNGGPIGGGCSIDLLLSKGDTVQGAVGVDDSAALSGSVVENYFCGHLVCLATPKGN